MMFLKKTDGYFSGFEKKLKYTIFAGVYTLLVLLCILIYLSVRSEVRDNYIEKSLSTTRQASKNIDISAEFIEQTAEVYARKNKIGDELGKKDYQHRLNHEMLDLMHYSTYIRDIYLFGINGNRYFSNAVYSDNFYVNYLSEIKKASESGRGRRWGIYHGEVNSPIAEAENALMYMSAMYDSEENVTGYMVINVDMGLITDAFGERNKKIFGATGAYIVSNDGLKVCLYEEIENPGAEEEINIQSGYKISGNGKYVILSDKAEITDMALLVTAPLENAYGQAALLGIFLTAVMVLFAPVLIFAEEMLIKSVIVPLEKLYKKMTESCRE